MSEASATDQHGLRARLARDEARQLAAMLIKNVEESVLVVHEYQEVDAAAYRHLDQRWYLAVQRRLEALGFNHLADMEDRALRGVPADPRTFLRLLVRSDGLVTAASYHPKPRLVVRLLALLSRVRVRKAVELETEFDDGTFICSTDAVMADELDRPPEIQLEIARDRPSIEALYARHVERVERYRAESRRVPLAVHSFFDALQAQNRQNALLSKHREQVGLVTLDEITRFLKGNRDKAARVKAEVDRIREERRSRA